MTCPHEWSGMGVRQAVNPHLISDTSNSWRVTVIFPGFIRPRNDHAGNGHRCSSEEIDETEETETDVSGSRGNGDALSIGPYLKCSLDTFLRPKKLLNARVLPFREVAPT